MNTEKDCVEHKIDNWVKREYQIVVAVFSILAAFYWMVLLPIKEQSQEIRYIKSNHLIHIETDIAEIRKKQSVRDVTDAEMLGKIDRVLLLLEEHKKDEVNK
jgi:hypothetical protein